jgi:hypothetical protein
MNHRSLLQIKEGKELVDLQIEAPFIAVCPKNDRRVVLIAGNDFVGDVPRDRRVNHRGVPIGQFRDHHKPEFITGPHEFEVGR